MSRTQRILDKLVVPAFAFGLQILVLIYASFLYFEGATQATTTGNIGLYDDMLNSAFVLAGFGIAAAVLTTKKERRLFALPTLMFLVSGMLMFGNLILPEFQNINHATATSLQNEIFDFAAGTGLTGILIFFSGLALLISNFLKWYVEQTRIK